MSENRPILDVRNLTVEFTSGGKAFAAVQEVNLSVYPGETVAIVGESGSGKSTTAAAVLGLLQGTGRVTGGEIMFEGANLAAASKKEFEKVRGSGIGLVPQDPMTNLNPLWRIGFQLREALVANGVASGRAAKARAVELLEEAGISDAERRIHQFPHEFSGGMRQRALIAIGLACRPKLLIADEPTSALDVTVQRKILDHLEKVTGELGTSVLLITHDLGLAAERASQLVVMYRGQVVESGSAIDILQDPKHEYTQRLVASAPSLSSRRLGKRAEASSSVKEEAGAADSVPVVRAENLVKDYPIRGSNPFSSKRFRAVDDVSFTLNKGSTLAVVGESGSGKSTLAQMVLGLVAPSSGSVTFDSADIAQLKGAREKGFRRRVQPVFQDPYGSLDPMYSIHRIIAEPLTIHRVGDRAARAERVRELLELVALPTSVMNRFPNELSGGQRQRVAIARALALNPEVLVLDEAVSALDVLVQAQVLTLLSDLQDRLGLTYLFITHDLAVVRQIADEILVMAGGKVVERGTVETVFGAPESSYTRNLLDSIPGRKLPTAG